MLAPPAERREHLEETLAFALELSPDFAMFTPTVPLPGAALYEELIACGCGVPDYDHQLQNFQEILYAPAPFTIRELAEFRSLCYRRFYLRPGYLFRLARRLANWDSVKRARRRLPLLGLRRKQALILNRPTLLGHPGLDRLTPLGVVHRPLVDLRRRFVAIRFIQNEPVRIVRLLKHVESQTARLQNRIPGILARRRDERLAIARPDVYVNTCHEHGSSFQSKGHDS